MRLKRLVSVSALFSLVSLVAFAGTDRAQADGVTRAFRGSGEGVVTEYVTETNWIIDYVGHATHFGNFTRREDITFTGPGTFEGTIVFVAVTDGDTLEASFTGHFISEHDAVGTYTFTGGSGRFSGATGAAEFTAYTPDFVHVSVTFEGTIEY
jgi:hypothetical protein